MNYPLCIIGVCVLAIVVLLSKLPPLMRSYREDREIERKQRRGL
jgi:hypothetical protein